MAVSVQRPGEISSTSAARAAARFSGSRSGWDGRSRRQSNAQRKNAPCTAEASRIADYLTIVAVPCWVAVCTVRRNWSRAPDVSPCARAANTRDPATRQRPFDSRSERRCPAPLAVGATELRVDRRVNDGGRIQFTHGVLAFGTGGSEPHVKNWHTKPINI